jgi:hypothetical protein
MKETLQQDAIASIKRKLKEINNQNNIRIEILPVDNIHKFTKMKIDVPDYLKV